MRAGKPMPSHPPQRQLTRDQVTGPPPHPEDKGRAPDSSRGQRGRGRGQLKIQIMIQRVQDARGGECIVLWDSGAQVSLVTHEYPGEPDSKDDLLRYALQAWGQAVEASPASSTRSC